MTRRLTTEIGTPRNNPLYGICSRSDDFVPPPILFCSPPLPSPPQGYTAYLLHCSEPVRHQGYFWKVLERSFPPEVKEATRGMRLCKDSKASRACDYQVTKLLFCSALMAQLMATYWVRFGCHVTQNDGHVTGCKINSMIDLDWSCDSICAGI